MELFRQDKIGEMSEAVKDAARNGNPDSIEGIPREAVIRAAAEGIVDYRTARISRSKSIDLNALNQEASQRLKLLSPEEMEEADAIAEERLHELIDY